MKGDGAKTDMDTGGRAGCLVWPDGQGWVAKKVGLEVRHYFLEQVTAEEP